MFLKCAFHLNPMLFSPTAPPIIETDLEASILDILRTLFQKNFTTLKTREFSHMSAFI